jgi:sugar lactone lactonase YvrE
MTMRAKLRTLTAALLSVVLSVLLVAPAEASPRHAYPNRIALPRGFQPEGITIGEAPVAYLGSLANGDIYAVQLRTGKRRLVSKGPGSPSVGLKIDRHGLLYVAGGPSGTARVVNVRTGKTKPYTLTDNASTFVNDVVLAPRAAWFTDSLQAQLYRVSRSRHGKARVRTVLLKGQWVQEPGFNANGIERTPDGHGLLVIQTPTGFLFRVDPRSGNATKVDLGGVALTNGDGLLLRGRTLYVVRNVLNQVAVVKLNRRGTKGTVVGTLKSTSFDVPTTVAAFGGSLYLPNARFNTVASPETADYWITRIHR